MHAVRSLAQTSGRLCRRPITPAADERENCAVTAPFLAKHERSDLAPALLRLEQVSRRDGCISELAASDLVGCCNYADTSAAGEAEKPANARSTCATEAQARVAGYGANDKPVSLTGVGDEAYVFNGVFLAEQ